MKLIFSGHQMGRSQNNLPASNGNNKIKKNNNQNMNYVHYINLHFFGLEKFTCYKLKALEGEGRRGFFYY